MRRRWSRFTPKSQFKKTQFLLHMQSGSSQASLEDSIKLSFSFWMVGQSLCITRKTLTTFSLYCACQNFHSFRTLNIEGTCLSITHCNVLNLWHYDTFLHHLEQHHLVNWTTRFLRLHLASFRVRFSIRAPPSIPHFIISFQPTPHPFSVNLVPFQNIARVHPPRFSDLANSFL